MAARPPAVARVLQRATAAVRANDMIPPGSLVLVACSGGPDSLCLLHALHRLKRLLKIRIAVFHFDHGLRRGAGEDAAYVERQAARLKAPFSSERAGDRPGKGRSVEAWARMARYAALTRAANETGADVAALGHTLDDQAETVLLGLVRGGGLESVAGMPPAGPVPPLGFPAARPLIEVTREETEAFCRSLRLRPREDPMNRDPRFLRVRLRRKAIPALERALGRNVRATLARTADHVRADAAYLDRLASEAAASVVVVDDDAARIRAEALAALPGPLASRVARQALRLMAAAGGEWDADVTAAHVQAVLDLAGGRPGRRADLPGALSAERDREYVRLSRSSPGRRPSRG
ncbi:MAG TPA: tRNA lysidine(34) synthetase TilS [Actinomycetota bacterium]